LLDNALGASRVLSSGTGPGEQAGYAIFIFLVMALGVVELARHPPAVRPFVAFPSSGTA
jgi:hypothetical protein